VLILRVRRGSANLGLSFRAIGAGVTTKPATGACVGPKCSTLADRMRSISVSHQCRY